MVRRSIALLVLLAAVDFGQTASVEGWIIDQTGAAIGNADVKIASSPNPLPTARTDVNGYFKLADVPAGDYQFSASAPGFKLHNENVSLAEGQSLLVRIALPVGEIAGCGPGPLGPPTISFETTKSAEAELYGTVAGVNQEFVARVRVSLLPINKMSQPVTIVTGPDSSFDFRGVTPGVYALRSSRRGYSDFVIDRLELKAGQRMHALEPLEMLDCPDGFHCKPNRKVHVVQLCM